MFEFLFEKQTVTYQLDVVSLLKTSDCHRTDRRELIAERNKHRFLQTIDTDFTAFRNDSETSEPVGRFSEKFCVVPCFCGQKHVYQ